MASAVTDQYLANNERYAAGEAVHRPAYPGRQPIQPARRAGLGIPGGLLISVMIYRIVERKIVWSHLWTNHRC